MDKDSYFSIIIIILLALGVLSIVYIILYPQPSEKFTEFYVLNAEGHAGNYPVNLTVGEEGKVILGIVNHEHATVDYFVVVKLNNTTIYTEEFSLLNQGKKEIPLKFQANISGNQKLEMFLYKLPDKNNVYRHIFLDLNVV